MSPYPCSFFISINAQVISVSISVQNAVQATVNVVKIITKNKKNVTNLLI